MLNNETNNSILNKALLGMEFEFYSNISDENIADQLSNLLNKNVHLYHHQNINFEPTENDFIIKPNFTGGDGMFKLITGQLNYIDARLTIINILNWINNNGYTTDNCSLHINLSWDSKKIDINNLIMKMNTLKFILEFSEDQIYKLFPNRINSKYAKSIKNIMIKDEHYIFDYNYINSHMFNYPIGPYYGIDFSKQGDNYLKYNYIGGEDYQKERKNILYLINSLILKTWKICNNSILTNDNKIELKKILDKNKHFIEILKNYRNLNQYFNNINIMIDLSETPENIDLKWNNIKYDIVDLISLNEMSEGIINYDTDLGKIQIKDGVFGVCYDLNNCDLMNCNLNGNINKCELFNCEINTSNIDNCSFFDNCEINESIIKSSFINQTCTVNNSYIYGRDSVLKGTMKNGIFKEGLMSQSSELENVEIIDKKQID